MKGNFALKKYKFGFDFWALILFAVIMIPNIIWAFAPAPNDVLRAESKTQALDIIASVCQVLFVAAICLLKRDDVGKIKITPFTVLACTFAIAYFIAWILYYAGIAGAIVILLLTVPPCLAFIFYALDRKNYLALIPASIFTVCHLIYAIVNFIA